MEFPLVSICVPVYGVEKFIEKCSVSLFEQTYSNIEYIFVDDCSPDKSIEVLNDILLRYPIRQGNVRIVHNEKNLGLAGTRNVALKYFTGEYLMHVDSDDYLDSTVVERLVKTAHKENADIVVYDMKYIYKDKTIASKQIIESDPKKYIKQLLTYKASVCVCGKLYKNSLFKDNDIWFIEGINFGEDYVTSPRIAYYAQKIAYCSDCYYNYVQYNASSYTNSYKSKNIDDLFIAVQLLSDFFNAKPDSKFYEDALNRSKLYNKIKMLIAICLNKDSVGNRLHEVCDSFIDLNKYSTVGLSLNYRIILWLSKKRLYNILELYIVLGFKLKQILKGILH